MRNTAPQQRRIVQPVSTVHPDMFPPICCRFTLQGRLSELYLQLMPMSLQQALAKLASTQRRGRGGARAGGRGGGSAGGAGGGVAAPYLPPEAFALPATCAIFSALAHVHAHGYAHRDVSPLNVLVAHLPSAEQPLGESDIKLCDFGHAFPRGTGSDDIAVEMEGDGEGCSCIIRDGDGGGDGNSDSDGDSNSDGDSDGDGDGEGNSDSEFASASRQQQRLAQLLPGSPVWQAPEVCAEWLRALEPSKPPKDGCDGPGGQRGHWRVELDNKPRLCFCRSKEQHHTGGSGVAAKPDGGEGELAWWQQADVYSAGIVVWQVTALNDNPYSGKSKRACAGQNLDLVWLCERLTTRLLHSPPLPGASITTASEEQRTAAIRRAVCSQGLRPWGDTGNKQEGEEAIDHHLFRLPAFRGLLALSRRCAHACVSPAERPTARVLARAAQVLQGD